MPEAASAPAPAGAAPPAGLPGQSLDDLMLAMDVVDTLRHQDSLVARELDETRRDAELLDRLRRIYKGQGIAVPERVLAEGVRALKESRFVYTPPPAGLARTLATLWVERRRHGRRILAILAAVLFAWGAYELGVVRLAEWRAEQARIEAQRREAEARAQAERERVEAQRREAEARAQAERERVEAQRREAEAQAQAERQRTELTQLLPRALEQGHADVVAEARVDEARRRAGQFLADGRAALARDDAAGARAAIADLETLRNALRQEYVLRIVSRPGQPSGVWRIPGRNPNARNYYLIVEPVAPDGRVLSLPVTSEEDGRTETVSRWGVRVSEAVFDEVRRDKNDDGIVQDSVLGEKRRGQLAVAYRRPVMGGAILRW